MFAARCIAVLSSAFFLVYVVLSFAVCSGWRRISTSRYIRTLSPAHRANLLFALRVLPFAAAAAVTAAFILPSFILLEPRAIEEPMSALPLALGACGICVIGFGLGGALAALVRASRLISRWTRHAKAVESQVSVPVLSINRTAPALTAAGILRPKVLLSNAAQFVLNKNELHTALRHEMAHVRRRDNLRKLSLRFVAFPGMQKLETAWLESTEMAADDAAVESIGDALDLAAALIKLSKITSNPRYSLDTGSEELMTAFIHGSAKLINARVERLIQWQDQRLLARPSYWRSYAMGAALVMTFAIAGAFAATYGQLLAQAHTATEWLVR